MAEQPEATIVAAGRRLKLVGTHSAYMQGLKRWRGLRAWSADKTAIATAVKGLPQGSLFLDVGAHIGLTAITVAVSRPDCRVVAFEPQPLAQKRLRQNLAANAITNVEVIEAAVSDFSGSLSFSDNGPWSVANHGTVACKSVRLDDLDLGAPSFIKIDVEGFEPNVLAGGHRLIAEARPLIFMEYCPWTLLLHHYDPLTFAAAIWSSFDVLQIFHRERSVPLSPDPQAFLHANLMQYECVNDLLLRPKAPMPTLNAMVHEITSACKPSSN
jgi:FkbM family methyltransferase